MNRCEVGVDEDGVSKYGVSGRGTVGVGCHVTGVEVEGSGCGWCVGSRGAVCGCRQSANGLRGCIGVEITHTGDGTDRHVDVSCPVAPLWFVWVRIKRGMSCGRWWVTLYLLWIDSILPDIYLSSPHHSTD